MSANPITQPGLVPRRLHALLNLFLVDLFGAVWVRFWLTVYPRGAATVRWTLHDELSVAPASQRWRRAIAFFAHLPRFASAQSEAESDTSTQTGGEAPEGTPPSSSRGGLKLGRTVVRLGLALVMAVAGVIALIVWVNGITALIDLIDEEAVSGGAAGAIAVTMLFAVVPLLLVYNRRSFAWTPTRREGAGETAALRAGWWISTAAFGLLTFVLYVAVLGHFLDAYDVPVGIDLGFESALGLAAVTAIGTGPLAWVVRRRYWVSARPALGA